MVKNLRLISLKCVSVNKISLMTPCHLRLPPFFNFSASHFTALPHNPMSRVYTYTYCDCFYFCDALTLHRASPSTQRSIRVYMTVTGRHTTHMRMSEHDRLAIRMLVTLRNSCCRAMMNTSPALPSNPTAMTVLYATIKKVAPPTEGGHWLVSVQSEAPHKLGRLVSLDMAGGKLGQRVGR